MGGLVFLSIYFWDLHSSADSRTSLVTCIIYAVVIVTLSLPKIKLKQLHPAIERNKIPTFPAGKEFLFHSLAELEALLLSNTSRCVK